MKKSRKNVIVAGVTKSATTSLYYWMADHPEVCVANEKEMHYFADKGFPVTDKTRNYHTLGIDGYDGCFDRCKNKDAKIYFDVSPAYYDEQETPFKAIAELRPPAKIIFILRRPSDRVFSMFKFMQNNFGMLDEKADFFETMDTVLKSTREDLAHDKQFYFLRAFLETCRYIDFIPKWFDVFGQKQVKVMIMETIKKDQAGFMKELSGFAGIDESFWDNYSYPRRNETFKVKNKKMHMLAIAGRNLLKNSPFFDPVRKLYIKINTGAVQRPSDRDEEMKKRLSEFFAESNLRLAEYLGVDLSIWSR